MRDPGISRCLLNVLLMLILTTDLVTTGKRSNSYTDAKQKATIFSASNAARVPYTTIPPLSESTLCLDLSLESNLPIWTVLSYCVESGDVPLELGMGMQYNAFQVIHSGVTYRFETVLRPQQWHQVCLIWKLSTKRLDVYLNGTRVFNVTTKDVPLKGNGSLVLGAKHSRNYDKSINLNDAFYFIGQLYYFQLWDYARSQDELGDCSEGNLISWTKQLWNFPRITRDETLRCANGTNKQTPTSNATSTSTTTATITATPNGNSSTTGTVNTINTSSSTINTTTSIFSTTTAQKDTTTTDVISTSTTTSSFTLVTIKPEESNTSTDVIADSSVMFTTGNNASTFGNKTLPYHSPPQIRTTKSVTFSPWINYTTAQKQESADANSTQGKTSEVVTFTASSIFPAITTTEETETSSNSKPSLVTNGDTSNVTTMSPNISTTQPALEIASTVSNSTMQPDGHITSVQTFTNLTTTFPTSPLLNSTTSDKPSSSPSTVTSATNVSSSTASSAMTESPVSPTRITNITTSETSTQPLPAFTDTENVTTMSPNISTTKPAPEISSTVSNSTMQPDGHLTSMQSSANRTTSSLLYTSSTTSSTTTITNLTTMFPTSPLLTSTTSGKPSSSPSTSATTDSLSTVSIGVTQTLASPTEITASETRITFYVVKMSIIISGTNVDLTTDQLKSMMYNILENTEFSLMDIIVADGHGNGIGDVLTQKTYKKKREINVDSVATNYNAKSVVQANSSLTSELLTSHLNNLLENKNYTDPDVSNVCLSVQSVTIVLLDPGRCPSNTTIYNGEIKYTWKETSPAETDRVACYINPDDFATRYCYINVNTERAEWGNPDYTRCLPSSFEELENVTVTPENRNYLAEQILNMTKMESSLPESSVNIILTKLSEIIALGTMDLENAKTHVDVINVIMTKASSLHIFTNRILNITEEIGYQINFTGEMANVTANSMALMVSNVRESKEMYFTVKSYFEGKDIEIALENVPSDKAVAYIRLPQEIQDQVLVADSKVQFNFFGNPSLFTDQQLSDFKLDTYIISASVEGTRIEALNQPVAITLRHFKRKPEHSSVMCAFWDFTINDNLGGWNSSGCKEIISTRDYTSCYCNHLTHFGVLLDISRKPVNPVDDHILSILTYVGCGIASLFLGIALVTYGMFKKLRKDYPSKILMNLSFSLLMLNLTFLLNTWLSSFNNKSLCISTAAFLHYFLLTSFTWMGLEAVHMYFAFVKVFNSYVHKYILKLCIAGWGIPSVVIVIVLSINSNFYGSGSNYTQYTDTEDNPSLFCWIENNVVFYVAVVGYFVVIFLINISMFIVVLLQIKSLKSTRVKDWKTLFLHDFKNTFSLAFLLGLTWGFAFFAWGPVQVAFLYLFAIFNTLQGFFIFLFHCLMKENVRKHWRMYLCCGRCRLDNYSDWSRLSNEDNKNGRISFTPSDSYQSTRSNNTASTSNSSSLSGFSKDGYYERSYINGGGIFINYAETAPSIHGTIFPHARRAQPDTSRILPFTDFNEMD